MRFMVIVKSNEQSEAGIMPPKELFADMAKLNEEMVNAGVLLAADGLQPSSTGARVKYEGTKRTVTDGPFSEAKELVGGFWILQVKSKEEAIEWARRVPFREGEVEVRQISEVTDFPPEVFSPEDAAKEQAMRDRLQKPKA